MELEQIREGRLFFRAHTSDLFSACELLPIPLLILFN